MGAVFHANQDHVACAVGQDFEAASPNQYAAEAAGVVSLELNPTLLPITIRCHNRSGSSEEARNGARSPSASPVHSRYAAIRLR